MNRFGKMNKFERIERLLYFREWAIALAIKTQKKEYVEMMIDTWSKLYDLGLIVTDVGADNSEHLLFSIERILGFSEKITKGKK